MDKSIKIAKASVRTAKLWPKQEVLWINFVEGLSTPVRGEETYEEYITMPKTRQDQLKDVGGFVGGWFEGDVRKTKNLLGRTLVTLDLDNIPQGEMTAAVVNVRAMRYTYCMYSTRKHKVVSPRLRVIFPLDRDCTPQEYEPLCRKLGELIGINYCDPTTFQPARLMYLPSVCSDGEYFFDYGEGDRGFVGVDELLKTYNDYNDVAEWAVPFGSPEVVIRSVDNRQSNPQEKKGVVGAFCRAYSVEAAIDEFLPDVYYLVDDGPSGRYTYVGGSTTSGAIVFDDGDFLYSYHSTDPAGGGLRNAFDLVRLHKFGELDVDFDSKFKNGSYNNPSNAAMRKFAEGLDVVRILLEEERNAELVKTLGIEEGTKVEFIRDKKKQLKKMVSNVSIVLQNDVRLRGKFHYDTFKNRVCITEPLPWMKKEDFEPRTWKDKDDHSLYRYFEDHIEGFNHRQSIDSGLHDYYNRYSIDSLQEYIEGLVWDGIPRAEKLFVDYLGAEDNTYNKVATRMWLVGAISRAMRPGCQFDLMLVFTGATGIGKSKFLRELSGKRTAENFRTFQGKESIDNIQGKWIVDVGELGAFSTATFEAVKNFLTTESDYTRVSYGRQSEDFPRRCVFSGTTNNTKFLHDLTGDRRFLPIAVGEHPPTKDFRKVGLEADQIWAEVRVWYNSGAEAFYDSKSEYYDLITAHQEKHREEDPYEAETLNFIEKQVPVGWSKMTLEQRRAYWAGVLLGDIKLVDRDYVSAHEVWYEALGGDTLHKDGRVLRRINNLIRKTKKWKDDLYRVEYLGVVRGFRKIAP